MAYPTGSGSERLHRGAIHNLTNADTHFRFEGLHPVVGNTTYAVPANHIVTILSIIVTEMANLNETFQIVGNFLGSTAINILYQEAVHAKETFTYNDKIVLHPTDTVKIQGHGGSCNYDVYYTYVEQDWS